MSPKIDFDKAFDMNDPVSRFGLLTTYFIVGSLGMIVCIFLSLATLTGGIELIYRLVLTLIYCYIFGFNIGFKSLKNWWLLYRIKPKEVILK